VKSVQESIEKALSKVLQQKVEVMGAGRTDAGVHAKQLFAHFDFEKKIDTTKLTYQINSLTPHTIVIKRIFEVSTDAHARFDATYRSYEYHINLENNPFKLETTWQLYNRVLDVEKMNAAAQILLKHTNFKAFSKVKTEVRTYNCDISEAIWKQEHNTLIFHITADRFLRNMVRAIVGTLLEVGEGKIDVQDFEKIITSQNRSNAGLSVPARGLFLVAVGYAYV